MATMNMLQAINNALDIAMAEDEKVICFGEDVGIFGGVFRLGGPGLGACGRNTVC